MKNKECGIIFIVHFILWTFRTNGVFLIHSQNPYKVPRPFFLRVRRIFLLLLLNHRALGVIQARARLRYDEGSLERKRALGQLVESKSHFS